MVRFIHAADIHLDSPFIGLKSLPDFLWEEIYQSTFRALTRVVDVAIEKGIDFLCIAGDIYDSDDRSVKAQAYLRNEFKRLEKAEIPVFICHGNHDYIENLGLHLDMPNNVVIFKEEVETHWLTTQSGERVAITSFSYGKRWVTERKIQDYPSRLPDATYQIGMLHGSIEGIESEHGVYAPFSIAELKSKQYDYWALGHIHKRQVLNEDPLIVYSGNTQGRSSKESGEKGCEFVEITMEKVHHEFFPTSFINWSEAEISLKGIVNLGDVYQAVQDYLSQLTSVPCSQFVGLCLTDTESLSDSVRKKIQSGELVEAFQQIDPNQVPFIWVHKITLAEELEPTASLSLLNKEWEMALANLQEASQFNEVTDFLFEQVDRKDQLEERDATYRKKMIFEAKSLIMQQLGSEGRVLNED